MLSVYLPYSTLYTIHTPYAMEHTILRFCYFQLSHSFDNNSQFTFQFAPSHMIWIWIQHFFFGETLFLDSSVQQHAYNKAESRETSSTTTKFLLIGRREYFCIWTWVLKRASDIYPLFSIINENYFRFLMTVCCSAQLV